MCVWLKLELFLQVKLSSSGSGSVVVWAGSGTLACTVSDTTVRCWEPHSGETYALSAQLPDLTAQTITCLAYSSNKGISVNSWFSSMITITTNTDKSKSWQKQIVSKLWVGTISALELILENSTHNRISDRSYPSHNLKSQLKSTFTEILYIYW